MTYKIDEVTGVKSPVTYESYNYKGSDDLNLIDIDCTCEVFGYKNNITAKTTVNSITFTETSLAVTTPSTNKLQIKDKNDENGKISHVTLLLGKNITYYFGVFDNNGEDCITWDAINLYPEENSSSSISIPMNGYGFVEDNNSHTIKYEKVVGGKQIAYKEYTFVWSGKIDDSEGIKCTITETDSYL
jgi:hypothetical protein